MGSRIPCFLIERAPAVETSLRRFTFSSNPDGRCGSHFGHDAEVVIGREPLDLDHTPNGRSIPGDGMRQDPRWPTACLFCGYVFQPEDEWQYNVSRLWTRIDTGEMFRLSAAPVGAMWHADWYPERFYPNSPDGLCLVVKTPGGDWMVDGPSSNGPGWTRTGTIPRVTARPSIAQPGYHGWLTDGVLEEC